MEDAEGILRQSADMDTPTFLRFLIEDRSPRKSVVTVSLRGRSVVVLKYISEIDPATPVVFCHMPNVYPESLEYRARLIDELGLSNVREPAEDDGPTASDCNHCEQLWAENPIDHTRAYEVVHLNRTLADFDCWISAVYHNPYPAEPGPRVRAEGRLIRVDPLASWTQDQVRGFMKEQGLPYHPQAMMRRPRPPAEDPKSTPSYHF